MHLCALYKETYFIYSYLSDNRIGFNKRVGGNLFLEKKGVEGKLGACWGHVGGVHWVSILGSVRRVYSRIGLGFRWGSVGVC